MKNVFFPGYGKAVGIPDHGQMVFHFCLKILKDLQHEISASSQPWNMSQGDAQGPSHAGSWGEGHKKSWPAAFLKRF